MGTREQLAGLRSRLREGPRAARVDDVEESEAKPIPRSDFISHSKEPGKCQPIVYPGTRGSTAIRCKRAHPRSAGLPEAGHPVLRHHHAAQGQARLGHADRRALRALHRPGHRSGSRHGSARLYFRPGARLSPERGICARPQARQTSGGHREVRLRRSNMAATRSRSTKTPFRKGSACSSSTICWPPAEPRKQPPSLPPRSARTSSAWAFVVELDFLKGREKLAQYDVFSLLHYDN